MVFQISSRAIRICENFVTFVTFCFLMEFVPLEMFPNCTKLWATDINKKVVKIWIWWCCCINWRIKPLDITWKMWRKTNVKKQLIKSKQISNQYMDVTQRERKKYEQLSKYLFYTTICIFKIFEIKQFTNFVPNNYQYQLFQIFCVVLIACLDSPILLYAWF